MEILFYLYGIVSVVVLMWTMVSPFGFGLKDYPIWTLYFCYPLSFLIMVFSRRIFNYFEKELDFLTPKNFLDLNILEKKLDDALEKETSESLTEWLETERKNKNGQNK